MTRSVSSGGVILVALDASPRSLAALQAAAEAAARLHAELRGMYVEDIDLVRTAELPFARAISSSGQPRPLTPETMQRQLTWRAEQARSAVEAAGVRSKIAWSFTVVRGTVHQEIERAASSAVFVTVGRSGWSARPSGELGSTVRALVTTGSTSILMVSDEGIRERIAVIYDGTPSSQRAIDLAAALKGNSPQAILVVAIGGSAETFEEHQASTHFEIVSSDLASLTKRLHQSGVRTVFISANVFRESVVVRQTLETSALSVFLVR